MDNDRPATPAIIDGRRTKSQTQHEHADLLARIQRLEAIIAKIAVYGGGAYPAILREYGLDPYAVQRQDMSRVRG